MKKIPFDVGVNYLSKVLTGSRTVLANGNSKNDFRNFGSFHYLTQSEVKDRVLELIEAGILDTFEGNFGNKKVCLGKVPYLDYQFAEPITKEGNWIKTKAQKTHANAYEPWTVDEDEELEELYCEGQSVRDLSRYFERSEGAIRARIEKLELEEKYG